MDGERKCGPPLLALVQWYGETVPEGRNMRGFKEQKTTGEEKDMENKKEGLIRWWCHEGKQESEGHGGKEVPF